MAEDVHELSALYALDVLSGDERARFEEHLERCERCRRSLRGLRERRGRARVRGEGPCAAARSSAERILDQARAESRTSCRCGPRRSFAVSIAAAMAVAAMRRGGRSRRVGSVAAPVALARAFHGERAHRSERAAGAAARRARTARRRAVGRRGAERRAAEAAGGKDVRGVGRGPGRATRWCVHRTYDETARACAARRASAGVGRAVGWCRRADDDADRVCTRVTHA